MRDSGAGIGVVGVAFGVEGVVVVVVVGVVVVVVVGVVVVVL